MNKTNITWCDYTYNPFTGCTNGCEYCYARKLYYRYGMDFTPQEHPDRLRQPLSVKKPSIIFLGSTGDIAEDAISKKFVDQILEVIDATPQHTYMLLTKHPEKLYDKLYGFDSDKNPMRMLGDGDFLPNLWLGMSLTSQTDIHRVTPLLAQQGFKKFLSIEPLLEELSLRWLPGFPENAPEVSLRRFEETNEYDGLRRFDLVTIGGVTPGKPLHETHPQWLTKIIEQCRCAGVPVHYKHQGKNPEFMGQVWDAMPTNIPEIAP
jgi:protein gp37